MSIVAELPALELPKVKGCKYLWVAVSGGVDSVVLLHWAVQNQALLSRCGLALKAIHVNHQLSSHSEQWQAHVSALCERLGVPLVVRRVNVAQANIEQAARSARYGVFEDVVEPDDIIMLGHHQGDQAETFLLRLMRGAGVQGLAAMPHQRSLGRAHLWRPFLSTPKAAIVAYAADHHLQWVDDESNGNTRFDRNFTRHDLIPTMQRRWPQAIKKIAQAADYAREAQYLMDEYASADLQALDMRQEKFGCSLSIEAYQKLSAPRQRQVLRYWLRSLGYLAPEAKHLEELHYVVSAKADGTPALWLSDCGFSRFAARLYLLPHQLMPCQGEIQLVVGDNKLADGSILTVVDIVDTQVPLKACFRQGGERARPAGRRHSQTLKKLLQEYNVPPWLRYQVPLIYSDSTLLAVGDYWVEEGCDIELSWQYLNNKGELK